MSHPHDHIFTTTAPDGLAPLCPYCPGQPVACEVKSERVYPHRPDLHGRTMWACQECGAYVGCHQGTNKPLGRLAQPRLRKLKIEAHAAFDALWRAGPDGRRTASGKSRRSLAYAWLAERLGIDKRRCHIAMFDEHLCQRVIDICNDQAAVSLLRPVMEA